MKKSIGLWAGFCLLSFGVHSQEIYGVFGLPPATDLGEKQIGTVDPGTGAITLLGTDTSVETGMLDMTTGATALNVNSNKSYFIGRDDLNVDRIYTVDLNTGITDTNPALTAGYTTSNNWGVWYDEPNATLYALFDRGTDVELAIINPATGAVTQQHSAIVGSGVALGSGLLTGDSTGERVFFIGDGELYVVSTTSTDTHFSLILDDFWGDYTPSNIFGLEWDQSSDGLWVLYNPGGGARSLAKIEGDISDGGEPEVNTNIEIDFGDPITTASGLSALNYQTSQYFFFGRPSTGANANLWSMYTIDLNTEASSNVNIENASLVQTNGYAGIEVLPGPELSMSKSDGGVTTTVPGDTITYTMNYSNAAGAGATSGLTLTETVPAETTFLPGSSTAGWACLPDNTAGSTCTLTPSELAPGGADSATFAVQVDAYVTAALTEISNSATLSADNAINDVIAADTTPITAAATLFVSKTDNDLTSAVPGDTVSYDITAANTGDRIASNAVLTETVPANTTYVPTAPFDWTCLPDNTAGSTCTTTAMDLASTAFATTFDVQIISSVPAGTTQISNSVTLSADNASDVQASDDTPVTSSAVLSVSKTDGDITLEPGNTVVYQIDYGNTGDQDADTTSLTETVLTETVFNAAASTAGWLCVPDNNPGSTCTLNLGTVGGGSAGSVDFALTLNTPVPGIFSQLTNTVVMSASNASTTQAQDTTPIDADVDLRIVKTDGGVTAALGKVINYTLINFNEGDRDALLVEISETVPDNTTFYPPSSTAGWVCTPDNAAGSTCTFDVGDLPGLSGKQSVFFAVQVDDSLDPGVTELSNTAVLSAFNSLTPDQDTELTPVDQIIPSVTLIDANPSIIEIESCSQNDASIAEVVVSFQDDNPGLIGVDDSNNFALVDTGLDHDLQTESCAMALGDDQLVNINTFTPGGTATNPNATLTLDAPLSDGQYVLLICDDITDAAGNAIDGDADGFPGGNLQRQFRIDIENLFNNAHLDDCLDNPVSLTSWNALFVNPDLIAPVSTPDFDQSDLSGSVSMQSVSSPDLLIEQCVNFQQFGSHTFSVEGLGVASQLGDLELNLVCAFADGIDCIGNSGTPFSKTFTLPPSTNPQWQTLSGRMLLPENTASAFCAVIVNSPTGDPFEYHLDEFKMVESDLIFAGGFEGN
ncbi:DUF11 domain-containing protein [Marinicella meishanensis]|uniref:DUF11 domain-containing protein n=1 Tax=Marinicella meishanensis TaxID=2873263 RepID=UPI001CBA7EFE|nr:DUF11 domain-containing protein [Marinicella sp. NBU2979]